jgi:hypothetical protein
MNPETEEAIRIADKHLAGGLAERRKALALDIADAIARTPARSRRSSFATPALGLKADIKRRVQ